MLAKLGAFIIAAIAVLSIGVCPANAGAWSGPGNPGSCPFPLTAQSDGCSLAKFSATTRIPTFFTGYAAQSGQGPYTVRPAWNVAGVDYPVGFYTPLAQLIDVRVSQPPGCFLRNLGASVAMQCSGSGDLLISGYRFDLHGGTFLIISSSNYTSATITNSYFLNGPVSDRPGGALVLVGYLVGDLIITNSTFDGNGRVMTKGLSYLVEDPRSNMSRDIIQQNAFFRSPQKGIGTGPCGDTFIQQNYFEELEASASHGEFTIDGSSACVKNNLVENYNTMLITAGLIRTGGGGIAAPMFLSSGANLRSWNTIIASHNTVVTNTIGNPSTSPGVGGATVSRMIEEGIGNVYKEIDYIDNFMDPTGSLLCYYVPTPTPAKTVMTGNTNLLNGSGINDFSKYSCYGHHP